MGELFEALLFGAQDGGDFDKELLQAQRIFADCGFGTTFEATGFQTRVQGTIYLALRSVQAAWSTGFAEPPVRASF